jgi:hypothetical protein
MMALTPAHKRRIINVWIAIVTVLIAVATLGAWIRSAAARSAASLAGTSAVSPTTLDAPTISYPNCRFGLGGATDGYTVTALNMGWSMDWQTATHPPHPNGAEYFQVIRLKPGPGVGYVYSPSLTTIYSIADQNPGAVWLIGNEPDSPNALQDHLLPETYARAYHDLYAAIKQHDPSAQIGAGNIVQPTPLRLQYLDRVLSAYQQAYDEALPADLWSTHSYILREIDSSDPDALSGKLEVWGASIPPGITATRGELYTYSQMFDATLFRQRLITFRAWLRDRGYRDTPLYITEYGTLFPYPPYIDGDPYVDELGKPMDEARTAKFMTSTFNALLNLTDASSGDPADANRVVQGWLWYSISDSIYGGLLFDPNTHARRLLGNVFAAYAGAIPPAVDLLALKLTTDPIAGNNQTATLHATISNIGNVSVSQPIAVAFYSGAPPGGALIGSKTITPPLAGCAATAVVSITWPNLNAGRYPVYARIDPGGTISETNETNNVVIGEVFVAKYGVRLPIVRRSQP